MSAALRLNREEEKLSRKPPLGEKVAKPRLVWENPDLSHGTQKEKPKVRARSSYGRVLYNYFRDYDPTTGRYVQSDPIGLDGGLNTYGYVGGNTLGRIDEFGLAWGIGEGRVPWNITHGQKACEPTDDCATLKLKAGRLTASMAERRRQMIPFSKNGQSASAYVGHAQQIFQQNKMLMKCTKYFNNHIPPCDGNCPAYNPYPLPVWKPEGPTIDMESISSNSAKVVTGVAAILSIPIIIIFGN